VNIVFDDIPMNNDNKLAKIMFAKSIMDNAAYLKLDRTNLGFTHSPVIGHAHWKPKYNGAIHKITRGKNPLEHHNKFPQDILKQIKKANNTYKKTYRDTVQNNNWVIDFLIDFCTTTDLTNWTNRHHVIEKNLAILIVNHPDRDAIIERYNENKKPDPANIETWFPDIINGKYTRVNPGELINYIRDNNIDYKIPESLEQTEVKPYTDIAIKQGEEYFKDENVIQKIRSDLSNKIIGNDIQQLLVFMASCSTQLPPKDRISIKIRGETSGGKTSLWQNIYENLPIGWYTDLTRMTRSVLEDNINTPGIYGGELDKNDNKALTESIKQYSEDGMKVWKKGKDESGEWILSEITKDRGSVIYSTTTTGGDEEEDTRFISLTVESSPDIWKQVNINTLEHAEDTAFLIEQLKKKKQGSVIQAGLSTLKTYDIISIPFSKAIEPVSDTARTLRDLKRFLSFIKISAWLHQHNRPKATVDGYNILYAVPVDFYWAATLTINAFRQTLTGIDERLQEVYNKVLELRDKGQYEVIEDAPGYFWVNRAKVQKELNIKKSDTIKEQSESLYQMGYLALHQGRGGSRVYLSIENDLTKADKNNHPLIRHHIPKQCEIIIGYLHDKLQCISNDDLTAMFTPHLPTNRPTFDLPIGEKTPKVGNGGSKGGQLGGQLVGSVYDMYCSNSDVNNSTYHENKKICIDQSKKDNEYIKEHKKNVEKNRSIHDSETFGGWSISDIDPSKYKSIIENAEKVVYDEPLPPFQIARRMGKSNLKEISFISGILKKAVEEGVTSLCVDKEGNFFIKRGEK